MIKKGNSSKFIAVSQTFYPDHGFSRNLIEFILRIIALYSHSKSDQPDISHEQFIRSVQSSLQSDLLTPETRSLDTLVQIFFKDISSNPVVRFDKKKDMEELLLQVIFEKISWEEINEFRRYLNHFLENYILQYDTRLWINEMSAKKIVSDITYVIQELLQNAFEYSSKQSEYELELRVINHRFMIKVRNYTDPGHASTVAGIINDLKLVTDKQELLLEYMISEEKHLGIISCALNYPVTSFNAHYQEEILEVECILDFFP